MIKCGRNITGIFRYRLSLSLFSSWQLLQVLSCSILTLLSRESNKRWNSQLLFPSSRSPSTACRCRLFTHWISASALISVESVLQERLVGWLVGPLGIESIMRATSLERGTCWPACFHASLPANTFSRLQDSLFVRHDVTFRAIYFLYVSVCHCLSF